MNKMLVDLGVVLLLLLAPALKVCAQEAPCMSLSVRFLGMIGEREQVRTPSVSWVADRPSAPGRSPARPTGVLCRRWTQSQAVSHPG